MTTLNAFATIRPMPAHRPAVLALLRGIVGPTRNEPGCRRFELHCGIDGDPALYLVECWDDEAALQAHHAMPYTVEAAAQIEGKLAAPTEVIRMMPAD